jgi:hypothetical protein
MAVGFALAAAGWAEVRVVSRRLAALVAAVALALPLLGTIRFVRDVARPATTDRALDWAAASLPAGARVLTRLDLGLDTSKVEVFKVTRLDRRPQVLAADVLFVTGRDEPGPLAGLTELAAFLPAGRYDGPPITALAVPEALRPPRKTMAVPASALSASSGAATLPAAVDGDRATWWHTETIQQAGDWMTIELGREALLGGIELALGDQPRFAARALKVEVRRAGAWGGSPWLEGRPRVEEQLLPASQVVLFTRPPIADAVRLSLTRNSGRRWGMAELTVWEAAP